MDVFITTIIIIVLCVVLYYLKNKHMEKFIPESQSSNCTNMESKINDLISSTAPRFNKIDRAYPNAIKKIILPNDKHCELISKSVDTNIDNINEKLQNVPNREGACWVNESGIIECMGVDGKSFQL